LGAEQEAHYCASFGRGHACDEHTPCQIKSTKVAAGDSATFSYTDAVLRNVDFVWQNTTAITM
jgi:hypothetical protein